MEDENVKLKMHKSQKYFLIFNKFYILNRHFDF